MEDEALLHAYVDGQLDLADQARVESRLQHDDQAHSAVLHWQAQRDQLRALHREVLDEPVPAALLSAAQGVSRLSWPGGWHGGRRSRVLAQALAAVVLLGAGVTTGWLGHQHWAAAAVAARVGGSDVVRALARDAVAAHVVYAPDLRRPVEIGADQQELLLRWLSRRLGRSLQLPQLGELGWQLVGGRLLSGDTQGAAPARAQFMYQNSEGQRLTLYLSVLAAVPAAGVTPQPAWRGQSASVDLAAFGEAAIGATRSVYWTEGTFGYALVGELPLAVLHGLVNEIYAQTPHTPDLP